TTEWQAHGHALAALAEIYHHQFIVLSVDEQIAGATGCSIDKSVHLMKELETKFNINLFDRFRMAYKSGEDIINCSREEFEDRIKKGIVDGQTLVFNNLISRRKELETSWNIPLADSWHAKVFSF
ncbi:MAG TPA: ABC transporter ATPase, partial [Daejeonella sp.]|nr:ABC transporter ATPase [Daejeonella sp.]